jgi:hypothetical protein
VNLSATKTPCYKYTLQAHAHNTLFDAKTLALSWQKAHADTNQIDPNSDLYVTPDGKLLVALSVGAGKAWIFQTGAKELTLQTELDIFSPGGIGSSSMIPNGSGIIAVRGGPDDPVKIDLTTNPATSYSIPITGQNVYSTGHKDIYGCCVFPDSTHFVMNDASAGTIVLCEMDWQNKKGTILDTASLTNQAAFMAVSSDGSFVFVASTFGGDITTYRVDLGKEQITRFQNPVNVGGSTGKTLQVFAGGERLLYTTLDGGFFITIDPHKGIDNPIKVAASGGGFAYGPSVIVADAQQIDVYPNSYKITEKSTDTLNCRDRVSAVSLNPVNYQLYYIAGDIFQGEGYIHVVSPQFVSSTSHLELEDYRPVQPKKRRSLCARLCRWLKRYRRK